MKRWKYHVITPRDNSLILESSLNEEGKKGWEVCGTWKTTDNEGKDRVQIILKMEA